jgi:hypothetical protein
MATRQARKRSMATLALTRGWLGAAVLVTGLAMYTSIALGGIRLDGTEVQSGSGRVHVPSTLKGAQTNAPTTLVFTLGQPIMAQGQVTGSGAAPTRIGLGYAYNHLYTSFCRCDCHADPVCDGVATVQDVVKTVGVAFRGDPPAIDTDCAYAGRTDVNCDGVTTVIDVVRMVDVAFRGADRAVKFCRPCAP